MRSGNHSGDVSLPTNSAELSQFTRVVPNFTTHLALVVVWCRQEPWRVGEVLELPHYPMERPLVFGRRDPRDLTARIELLRRRPQSVSPASPLNLDRLSRRQIELQVGTVMLSQPSHQSRPEWVTVAPSLQVSAVGKCPILVQGERCQQTTLRPGDVLELDREMIFLCTLRPVIWPLWPQSLPVPQFPFGGPDPDGIVGESPECWSLRRDILLAATSHEHTLVLGERGSGKEAVARAIHRHSKRARQAYVTCDLSAIPEDFVSTELFGNCAGYPPGARPREGMVQAAHRGTLLLDEIGDVPPDAARDLRRFLQAGDFRPLGAATPHKVDVRVIGATNRGVEVLPPDVGDRFLRRIYVPSLSQRAEDIPLISYEIIRQHLRGDQDAEGRLLCRNTQDPTQLAGVHLSPYLSRTLLECGSSGSNVRGLQRLITSAIDATRLQSDKPYLDVTAPPALPGGGDRTPVAEPTYINNPSPRRDTIFTREELEHLRVLRTHHFDVKCAAHDPRWDVSEPTAHRSQRILIYKALIESDHDVERAVALLAEGSDQEALVALFQKIQKRVESRLQHLRDLIDSHGIQLATEKLTQQDGRDARWGLQVLEWLGNG